ncbi:hypothetical protein WJX84_004588 [Apatococcus fuscideae]|uniref:Uncharacterized protein n=1 Tax=Apatococcus fuscideae TaxID=2026836 RepID=A0AAW1TD14_9CHLO
MANSAQQNNPGKSRVNDLRLQDALTAAVTNLVVYQPADPLCWLYKNLRSLAAGTEAAERAIVQLELHLTGSRNLKEAAASAFLAGTDGEAWAVQHVRDLVEQLLPVTASNTGLLETLVAGMRGPCHLEEFMAVVQVAVLARETSEAAGQLAEASCQDVANAAEPFPLDIVLTSQQGVAGSKVELYFPFPMGAFAYGSIWVRQRQPIQAS